MLQGGQWQCVVTEQENPQSNQPAQVAGQDWAERPGVGTLGFTPECSSGMRCCRARVPAQYRCKRRCDLHVLLLTSRPQLRGAVLNELGAAGPRCCRARGSAMGCAERARRLDCAAPGAGAARRSEGQAGDVTEPATKRSGATCAMVTPIG